MRRFVLPALSFILLVACGDDAFVCPEGFERDGDGCVVLRMDAGPDASDSSVEGGVDAGDAGLDAASPCATECMSETPLCNLTSMECVQCLVPEDCAELGVNTMCSDAGSCVQCMGNADCSEPGASVCSTEGDTAGSCVGCTVGSVDDCAGVVDGEATALNVCDDSAGSAVCVECNAEDESACEANVCDVLAHTCADDVMMGSAEACEACVSDRQCEDDLACVPVGAEPRGYYCMTNNSGGCSEPFTVRLIDRTSISGLATASYCGINEALATCENVRSLLDNATCDGGMDEECPASGLCRRVGDLLNRCTYECGGEVQCDAVPNPGSSCGNATNMGMGVDYCGGDPA
jgi:hypothetical protein